MTRVVLERDSNGAAIGVLIVDEDGSEMRLPHVTRVTPSFTPDRRQLVEVELRAVFEIRDVGAAPADATTETSA